MTLHAPGESYAQAALDRECEALARTTAGRNEATNRAAFNLGQLVGAGLLGRRLVEARLLEADRANGYVDQDGEAAACSTIRSGLERGMQQPRSEPAHTNRANGKGHDQARSSPPSGAQHDSGVPAWTRPDNKGRPKFFAIGRSEIEPRAGEVRRHISRRDGQNVRIKVKLANGAYVDFYRVRRPSDGAVGWQARKPAGYAPVPYTGPPGSLDPFDPEHVGDTVFWPEGEKDVDTLAAAGALAFTFGGSSDVPAAAAEFVAGRHVVILPDNDEPGRRCAARKAALAAPIAASVRQVDFPELDPGGDVSDWLSQGGTVNELQEYAAPIPALAPGETPGDEDGRFPPPVGETAPARKAFPILHIDDIEIGDDPVWLIEGLMPAAGFGVVFGPPKSLKSFLLADALFHVAMGRAWAGRDVMQGVVVYVTAEGVEGFKRRLIAMRRHYGVEGQGVPFLMVPVAPDLGHGSGDEALLVESIKAYLAAIGGQSVRAVAIDTLARTMKGADENAAKDMTAFVDNCERIGTALGCIVIGVHHAGKDLAKGSRGSNALDGAVDVMWSVEKGEASSTATIHHMKDSEAGATWQFRLLPHVLREGGATSQNVAAAVVEIVSEPGGAQPTATKRNARLPDQPKMLLSIIREVCAEAGDSVRGDPNVPHDVRSISRDNLKRYLPLRGYWDTDKPDNANRSNFSRDLKTLKVRGFIGLTGQWVWLPKGAL